LIFLLCPGRPSLFNNLMEPFLRELVTNDIACPVVHQDRQVHGLAHSSMTGRPPFVAAVTSLQVFFQNGNRRDSALFPEKAFNHKERNEKPRSSQETRQVLLATFADFLRELSG
jgi:hypothetical protein